ncbi:hypothetical protein LOC68_26925 [Blastopirellula sp. JC732]|uniref:Uncharacterized protein n=1 Tax=Blastopirellula sediminis TaxID=2894196 RepID=A0A9X1MR72_9BACT|nr:hypothetical protein [Blastopirellula sediminis]MCC9604659.1 hypothetical protein [Blastopirellula sediminis]MCC9632043.1 hypothetical protein [Blastopirellula sediminis]
MKDFRRFFLPLLIVGTLTAGAFGVEWKTGVAFEKHLESEVDLQWEDVPLRDALQRLAQTQEIAFFLDRRIDPDRLVSLSANAVPLEMVVQMLAQKAGGGSCHVGSVVYIGPADTARDLATVAAVQTDFARQSRDPAMRELVAAEALSWPDLTEPRKLLTDFAQRRKLTFANLDAAVSHDLWRASELPKIAPAETLTLLLAGFGATYRFGKNAAGEAQLQLIPLPENPQLTRRIPFRGDLNDAASKIKAEFPELGVETQAGAVIVTGRFEEVTLAGKMLRGETIRRMDVTPAKKLYTLEVKQQPLGAVLASLAKSLALKVEAGDDVEETLHQRISFSVDKVDVLQLLQATMAEVPVRWELKDDVLTITPNKK